jgi:hypothetical protein
MRRDSLFRWLWEEPKERSKIKKLTRGEKARKMRMVCPRFIGSLGKDIIIAVEFVSKHGHPGFRGTSPSDTSMELPHVGL